MVARGMNFGVVLRSPLLLVTFVISFVAWFVAFIGMAVGEAKFESTTSNPLYGIEWFVIWVQIIITVFFFIACAQDTLGLHRIQLSIFLAICISLGVQGVQRIYTKNFGASTATGVGWLLLVTIDILWLLFLSSDADSWLYDIFTNVGLPGWNSTGGVRGRVSRAEAGYGSEASGLRMNGADRGMNSHDVPAAGYSNMTGGYGGEYGGAPSPMGTPMSKNSRMNEYGGTLGGGNETRPVSARSGDTVQYKHRAKANYAYSASVDDPNEVSFAKGDILEVVDTTGKWFQVRTPSGQIGIAPSNYLTIL